MLKKILPFITLTLLLAAPAVHAEKGDTIGYIYSTDIRTYINGKEVPSYNIGGQTAIIIEDITTSYSYLDNLRTLEIFASTAFSYLNEFDSIPRENISGNIVGDIYETDIETYIFGMKVPSYNIGGKTAVVIEDFAGFKEYNDYGARYFYDDETRILTLEVICRDFTNEENTMREHLANVNYSLSEDKAKINAEFSADDYGIGGSESYSDDLQTALEGEEQLFLPIMTVLKGEEKQLGWFIAYKEKGYHYVGIEVNGEILTNGYAVNEEDDDYTDVYELEDWYTYFPSLDAAVLDAACAENAVAVLSPRQKTIQQYLLSHTNRVVDRINTDEYSFLYTGWFGGPHGGNYEYLLRVDNDGNTVDYAQNFESVSMWGQKHFENVTIDKENEKCYFHYDKDYVIDLKTGEMTDIFA
ncbi:MAG: hypothetical protein PUD92_05710 [Clostridiales bacterium]|nr:hypothetical protein [Clostridiales bacterium]